MAGKSALLPAARGSALPISITPALDPNVAATLQRNGLPPAVPRATGIVGNDYWP
jgi:hypothetical protein